MRTKREHAEKDVNWSMLDADFLRSQWQAQVESATQPLPSAFHCLLCRDLLVIFNFRTVKGSSKKGSGGSPSTAKSTRYSVGQY